MKMVIEIIGFILLVSFVVVGLIAVLNPTHRMYKGLVTNALDSTTGQELKTITSDDLDDLPNPVQKYLNYVGVIGTEKVSNFRVKLNGEMKMNKDSGFSPYNAEQTSFLNQGIRLFYMDLYMRKIKISGLHHFNEDDARMKIKILDVFTVVNEKGEKMRQAETVTFFNDMVILAPQTLISDQISWKEIDDTHVNATFTHNGIKVQATLKFDKQGRLINFISEDRLALGENGTHNAVPWSTPISEYQKINGLNLAKYGEAIWHYEDGDFTYITLNVSEIEYNIKD